MAPVRGGRSYAKGPLHEARLENALAEMRNGMPLREASKRFNVSRGALEYRQKMERQERPVLKPYAHCKFTRAQEEMLVDHCLKKTYKGYGMTPWQIIHVSIGP